ncbi:acylneuraminate cytidylyltransferase family protein [Petrocella sp. FN5]|uniref:acylneuraminate cytidylyltransferase family protein n=1 Tax=Petrocella sp. FN5 TaxID=3032002 RepID=UPI0023DA8CE6|nr:acylneuraminate cytidylyltransferase family protein [Petrocella sp. FN5]MDF1616141.1 acylneuraminate cytidylyltransferase family protein [Petrocella sp. FN5]
MEMKTVAFVPIKLNSQRLPNKNILPVGGQPLCWHILDTLSRTKGIDEVYVYCSDEKVKEYIPDKVKFLKRDKQLDGDLVKGFDIYDAFIKEVKADIYILAHTTSPFIKRETVESALDKMIDGDYDSAFSAQRVQTFAWYNGKPINYDLNDVPRTQDMEPIYVETSGFFMFRKEIFTENRRRIGFKPYIQEVDSIEAVDIDTKEDYEFALLISQNMNKGE